MVRKYDYWHIVREVSKEYLKKNTGVKVGVCITLQYKHGKGNEHIDLFDLENGKEIHGAYSVDYLLRIDKDISKDKKTIILKEAIKKWKSKQKVTIG